MECNKEEALRARSIAEKRMQCKDFVGAQKFALKALQLFPDLENISQMLTVCEVHCAAETRVSGSEDWYGILQVEPTADEPLIKKQYRKLALLLHPDKNKFAGAEAAFKLVGEAHRTLSDKAARSLYDMKRKATIPTMGRRPPPHQPNMSSNAWKQPMTTNIYRSNATTPLTQQQAQTANAAQTFWTLCPSCGTRYQYFRTIINKALRCQNCMNPFMAYDLNAQGVTPSPPVPNSGVGMKNVYGEGVRNNEKENSQVENGTRKEQEVKFEKVKFEHVNKRKPVVHSTGNPSSKRRKKMVEESSDTDNTDSDEISLEESEGADSSDTDSTDSEGNIIEESEHAAPQDAEMRGQSSRRSTRQKHNISYNEDSNSDNDSENLTSSEQLRRKLHKSDAKLSEDDVYEVEEQTHATSPKSKLNDGNRGSTSPDKDKPTGSTLRKKCTEGSEDLKVKDGSEGRSKDGLSSDCSTDKPHCDTLSYPDPEFHDFDEDRVESCLAVDQIWALYDDLDGMPRFYVRIKSVSSTRFMVHFTWLEYRHVSQAEKDWFYTELPTSCGTFRHGKTENTEDIQLFSHIMPANRDSKRNSYSIYPRKGEVWALFKDWDIKWSSNPDQHRQYDYEFVEILSDFASDAGVNVRPLVKVKGFVSLFCPGGRKATCILHIPPSELLRFSHMVPSYKMTGKEREGIPEGSYELDPASLPTNFEETLDSVALDEVGAQDEHRGNVNGTQCLNSRTMEKKSTNDLGKSFTVKNEEEENEKIGIGKSLDGSDESANVLKHTYERRHSRASGSHISSADAERNMVNNEAGHLDTLHNGCSNVMENGNGSPSDPSCPTVSECSDSEFYDFYSERSTGKFQAGQIWALYCELDDFPKYYALVKKVSSEDFKVHITWLDGYPMSKQEEIWLSKDLPLACGRFLYSSRGEADEVYDTTAYFSHMVQAELAGKGRCHVYPQVGQVWAVYKKWNAEWGTSDLKDCAKKGEYEVVEVLSSNASMFVVTILEKVDGFKAVFKARKNGGVSSTMTIQRNEQLRFSHQIPSFRLTRERGGKLCGYWYLDAASLPDTLIGTNSG
ncbi:hypothetical protein Taro_050225 [Colocasia esculenta]|uniref:J domain-containing protein n=1 Tax=Colocasia esculenta TaxID=4460 RepID=A0A843XCX4_COLES|nr:hypothetical protein [Colocasia esculenta]